MSEPTPSAPNARSWRTIRQEVTARAMSPRGRRRQQAAWLKGIALTVLLAGSAWGISAVVGAWESNRAALATAVKSEPVREVVLVTDGVLTREWVVETIALPRDLSLMALDLTAVRQRLMAHGQVRVAVLTRSFPDTLVVTLQERTPVARIQVQEGLGQTRQLLVAKDGVAYDGVAYDKTMLAGLPWLAGFSLRRAASGGYEPIPGLDRVADLLTTAQIQAPHLYRDWLIVSLDRLADRHELVVKAQDIPEIVFSTRDDFFRQLAQLDYIIDATRTQARDGATLASVNLALGPQVPVRLDGPAAPAAEAARPARTAPAPLRFELNLQPSNSRTSQRDL